MKYLSRIIILLIFNLLSSQHIAGEVTVNIFFPSIVNTTYRLEINGIDKGEVPLKIKSTKTHGGVDFITPYKCVLPIKVNADGPINILVEQKYRHPEGTDFFSYEEIMIENIKSKEYFFSVSTKGMVFSRVRVKELEWVKGNKNLKSNKWTLLSPLTIRSSERYKPTAEFLALRKSHIQQKDIERDNESKTLKKELVSNIGKLLQNTVELAQSTASLVQGIKDLSNGDDRAHSSTSNEIGDSRFDSDEKMYYIPDLLASIDRDKIAPDLRKLKENESAREKTRQARKTKMTRIGGKMIEVTDMQNSKVYTTNNFPDHIYESTIRYFEKIKSDIVAYGRRNRTDYISEEDYNNIVHTRFQADEKASQNRKKLHKERTDARSDKVYQRYEDMLMRHFNSNDRDFSWISDCQRKMREIRKKTGCKKSPWEDWDGGSKRP